VPVASGDKVRRGWRWWLLTVGYWFFTLVVSYEMVAGSMWDLLRIEFVRTVFDALGYPHYMLTIIGVWKLPCAVVLLLPRLLRAKEWAYAGAFFNYSGAAASHLLAGDVSGKWVGPAMLGAFTVASWALRPQERRLSSERPPSPVRPIGWVVPIVLVVVLLGVALATLPKGPNPY
jgi:hypothetical protein